MPARARGPVCDSLTCLTLQHQHNSTVADLDRLIGQTVSHDRIIEKAAKIADEQPHLFRDPFAVDLL
jgi:hypothetical protein